MPVLSAADQRYADTAHKNENQAHLEDGCRVYAMYGKEYYPAVILKRHDINSYEVIFVQVSFSFPFFYRVY